VRSRLDALIDGGLDALDEARDRGHLEACCDCRARLERASSWLESMRDAGAASATDLAFANSGLAERLSRLRAPRPSGAGRAWFGASVAAAAVLAMAAFESWSSRSTSIAELFARAPSTGLELGFSPIDWRKDLGVWRSE
jgi:anti-sigma factor RsiW